MVPALLFLTLGGCLERVTGEPQELDPRFYAGHVDPGQASPDGGGQPSDPNAGGYGDKPWGSYQGETIEVKGSVTVTAADNGRIQIDVAVPDDSAQGGQKRVGAVILDEPGEFVLAVPKDVTKVKLEAFQDPDINGPSEQDPYAELTLQLNGSAPAPVELRLEVGARGRASGSPQPAAGSGGDGLSFPEGAKVALSGEVLGATSPNLIIDVFRLDATSGAGRTYVGKIRPVNGKFSVDFPVDYGAIELEAYQDLTGDSRTADDIAAPYSQNPVSIGSVPVPDIKIQFP